MKEKFREYFLAAVKAGSSEPVEKCDRKQLYYACGQAVNAICRDKSDSLEKPKKRAAYFSAEFLTGNFLKNDLLNLGILDEAEQVLRSFSRSLSEFDTIADPALGNGGLGRLAACYLDSAACTGIPLDGYGIRYKYGLFRQKIKNGKQHEICDDWQSFTDPFGIRNEKEAVTVRFADQSVRAVPYDYYIIGTDASCINRLRLYQAECEGEPFEFSLFRAEKPGEAYEKSLRAQAISAVLYPDDTGDEGKKLRIRQQYFFCSAALQNILHEIKSAGQDVADVQQYAVIQLNDTHPAVAVPEMLRLLMQEGLSFDEAFEKVLKIFAYTNHTVMAEALETWDCALYKSILPEIYEIIERIDFRLKDAFGASQTNTKGMKIIENGSIHMARLCVFCCFSVNGVADIHTNILKNDLMKQWHYICPKKFSNKTNGVTQRRWLALANPALKSCLDKLTGGDCARNIELLGELKAYADDPSVLEKLYAIRSENKKRLCEIILEREHESLDPDSIFFVQVKRIHEYKRQLMNILSIIDIYYMMKSGLLDSVPPMTFIIGGKAAASYVRAKQVIDYINRVAQLINTDPEVCNRLKVLFIENYDVSYAEKIIPAADFSEQISLVTTEASGTGNMKFMMNGAVTLGTYDGANVEIARHVGEENCIIFGMRQQDYEQKKENYDAKALYASDVRIKRAVDSLLSEKIDRDGELKELFDSLVKKDENGETDKYMVLEDMKALTQARINAANLYADTQRYRKMSLLNIASSAYFSSDRAVKEYAQGIWFNDADPA